MLPFPIAIACGGGITPAPQLTAVSDPLESDITSGANRPVVSIRFLSTGEIQEATGDTGAALSYSTVGNWINKTSGLTGSEWEINFTVDSEDNGQAGTWTGSTRGSYVDISADRTYTWTKDTTGLGTANSEVTITVREVADATNSASRSNLSYDATVSP